MRVHAYFKFLQVSAVLLCLSGCLAELGGENEGYQNDGYGHGSFGNNDVEEPFIKRTAYTTSSRPYMNQVPAYSLQGSSASASSSSGSYSGPGFGSSYSSANSNSFSSNAVGKPCTEKPKSILNALTKCSIVSNSCMVQCLDGYQFPNGDLKKKMLCEDGEWTLEKTEWSDKLACEPICSPPCQNNGICIEPGTCSCPENFVGPYCQQEKKLCLTRPPVPHNSKLSCSSTSCTISCAKGYIFPDGSSITNMMCKDGQWIPSRADQISVPDCQPTCTPSCQNGGKCLSYNVCQCEKDFRGKQCQYNVEVCSPTKMKFNGAYRCSGDNESFRCKLSCPNGIAFLSEPADEYVCQYEHGYFTPPIVPQCNITADMEIIRGPETSHSFTTLNRTSVLSGSTGGSRKIKKIRKKGHRYNFEDGDSDDESYEKIITKTKIIVKKGRKKVKGVGGYDRDDEYVEYEDEDNKAMESMQAIGVYSLYLSNDLTIKHRVPKPATCTTWNGNKVKTFDGLIYNHNLRCTHTLVKDKIDGSFSVVLHGCSQTELCSHTLEIWMSNDKYIIENLNNSVVLFKENKEMPIPTQIMGLRITKVGLNYKINLELIGLTIIWDARRMVNIEASAALFNRTAGLCGTLDQDIGNDFSSKDGSVHKTVSTFVDAWKLPDSMCDNEVLNDAGIELVCTDIVKKKAIELCNSLIDNQKFNNCLATMNKEALLDACVTDFCYCSHSNRQQCACDGISVFAKECQFQGATLNSDWRDVGLCPLPCDNGRIYKACGPVYEQTCGSAIENPLGLTSCNEGCFCPDGMIQNDGKCIRIEECPCTLRGKTFKPGSEIKKDCNSCKCEKGVWKCSDKTCGARCGTIGDPHYSTFDGKRFDFMGKCSYYLLKTDDDLEISAENVACPGSISETMNFAPVGVDMPSCTKSVTIKVRNENQTAIIHLKQGRQILIDGNEITRIPMKIFDGFMRIRFASSTMLLVAFRDGLKLWWDGMTRVYIDAPPSYRGKTKGLCGTFDSNQQNDFLTPEGDVESSVASFANKWRTKENCAFVNENVNIPHPCQANMENKQKAIEICGKLKSKIFDECHWYVDPEPYYEDCMYDMCACKGDISSCMCSIFAAYSNECSEQGSIIHWRQSIPECGIKCPAGQIYEECSDKCYRSCADIESTSKTCRTKCVEGCRCPDGEALDDNNECIPIKMCPCAYKGLTFNSGYKEVRPGTKHLDLCTCSGADWNCIEATASDKDKYPPAADIRNQCLIDRNEEFTTCKPTEQKTCKNMNSFVEIKPVECRPGCVCKKGYVFDVSVNKCVRPNDCSCHHGSKSYSDGDKIKTDCNSCVCKGGNWNCTDKICPAICTVYGDSHFTTYDKKDFDFQGACSYVLSKGALDSDEGFTITIQNVMCGSQGVTCSKSVNIALLGSDPESVTLNSDSTIPGSLLSKKEIGEIVRYGKPKSIIVYRAGIFVVVEMPELGILVKWDRGTRIYVKLSSKWRNHVQGLCGNFDGDATNDFKSPSTGLETSAVLFGDSWKLENFCPQPMEQIDACNVHSERKLWAEKKCDILKSHVFSACHSEVEVDVFLRRCIFDSCACDQGGDCECLCTAIAAYAHACTMRGVPIRWRTPDLCPMQCDAHCSEYKPCISSCSVETCDNFLSFGKDLCSEDSCVEGCAIKPCPDGQIYKNDSYTECVPKSVCRPICMSINGVDYYEGDEIHSDNCQTCHCSKGKRICIGVPCTATSILPYHVPSINQDASQSCQSGWSEWINQDILNGGDRKKDSTKIDDREPLPNAFMLKNYKNSAFCDADFMKQIECRSVDTHSHPKSIGEDVECSLEKGLICEGQCHDYEIRVLCDCHDNIEVFTVPTPIHHTTPKPEVEVYRSKIVQQVTESNLVFPIIEDDSICDPVIPNVEKPGNCHQFYQCAMNASGLWTLVEKTCGKDMMFNPQAMICDHIDNVKRIKPECGKAKSPISEYEIVEEISVEKWKKVTTEKSVKVIDVIIPLVQYGSICDPAIPHVEKSGDCHQFYHCQMNESGVWTFVEKTCGNDMMFNPQAMICDHIDSVKRIKPQCGHIEELLVPKCPAGKIWSHCATPCGRSCHFYSKFLQGSGLCTGNYNGCEPGCIDGAAAIDCPAGQFWRDDKVCVNRNDCTCRSDGGSVVKPGSIFKESSCKVCQCIDNSYVCDASACIIEKKTETIEVEKTITQTNTVINVIKEPIVINTVTPPVNCAPERLIPLVNGAQPIPDTAFNASSYLTSFFKPQFSRLNTKASPESSGSWSPEINDQMQYLQIGFERPQPMYGVIIQGSPIFDQYVTSFKILHSFDGKAFHYLVDETKTPQIFSGPIDSRTPVKSMFKIPIESKVIRIYPLTWHGSISIRAELLGCSPHEIIKEMLPTPAPLHHEEIIENPMCDDAMGVDNGNMNIDQISLSSFKVGTAKDAAKQSIKLSSVRGWKPNIDSPNEYVVFDFLELRNLTGIKTKGGQDCWVTAYTILYSKDLILWNQILRPDGKEEQIFLANFDGKSEKLNNFRFPVQARAIKFVPTKWQGCIETKIEPIGCFVPYKKPVKIIEKPVIIQSVCNICPGVDNNPHMIEGICQCDSNQFWNGIKCVERNLCPCIVEHMTYGIGAQFEKSDCSQCICVLGGIAQCKPRECRPCGPGLRRTQLGSCLCACEPCPANQILCQTSGECIPEKSWCDGIQDCPDDEINCAYKLQSHTKTIKKITEKVVITETCPEPKCPPGFYVKVVPSKKQKASAMLENDATATDNDTYDGIFKSSNDEVEKKYNSKLPLPGGKDKSMRKKKSRSDCVEYDCIPEKPIISGQTEKIVCTEPSCPSGYKVTFDGNIFGSPCKKYKCELVPIRDVVCNITGRTFNTFDEIEYKYDVCDHILARDLLTNKWIISLQINCSDGNFVCRRQVAIVDTSCDLVVILRTNLTISLDGYEFTVDQLQKSVYSQMNMFAVSKVGDSILFVFHTQGIWVRLDNDGDVKVGISSKYISHVDGLCGFYNEYRDDDKRLPNGTVVMSTVDFGDSWLRDASSKQKCVPHACSHTEQDLAWELCSKIKDETFASCSKSVNADHFISKCLESACECLRSGSKGKCKCSILTNYVTECMAADENLHFDTWRSKFECAVECPPSLVHRDCYRRRCELSCETLNGNDCPYLPGTCFPGCYCPEGTVRKGDKCVAVNECKDCVCDGFGGSQFITYDRKNFTFDGKCTYLLSRDIVIPNVHTFQVYATLGQCEDGILKTKPKHSCTKSLHILYGEHIIHLQRNTSKSGSIQTIVDGIKVAAMPLKKEWLTINEERKNLLKIDLIKSSVELNAIFDDLSFSIKLPSVKYGNKVEGFCGNCNGDANDDLKPNPKYPEKSKLTNSQEILQTWMADEPKLNLTEKCITNTTKIDECVPLPPDVDPCLHLLDAKTFGKCHLIVDALKYVSMCQIDMCKIGPQQNGACSHLAAYARECSRNGICADWKKGACSEKFECPTDMEYKVCNCHKTCETIKENKTMCVEPVDGCFCRDGKVLNANGKCVAENKCQPCDDSIHYVGDKWQSDKCTECVCNVKGQVQCTKKQCVNTGIVCQLGFKQISVASNNEECCPSYKCVPEIVSKKCPEKPLPKCGTDQYVKVLVDDRNCTSYVCQCKPVDECKLPVQHRPLYHGEKILNDTTGCCMQQKIICDKSQCPTRPSICEQAFYEVIEKESADPNICCKEFICIPPKHLCIIDDKGNKIAKKLGDTWPTNDPCMEQKCIYSDEAHIPIIAGNKETCSVSNCTKGFKLHIPPGKCCGECKQEKCVIDDKVFDVGATWYSNDNCTTFKCNIFGKQFVVSSSMATCPDLSECPKDQRYFKDCCEYCQPKVEDKKLCLPVSLSESQTIGIIEISREPHGKCKNTQPIRGFTECSGACNSGTKFNRITMKQDKKCHCCSVANYEEIKVPVKCFDGTKDVVPVSVPKTCTCQNCGDDEKLKADHIFDFLRSTPVY